MAVVRRRRPYLILAMAAAGGLVACQGPDKFFRDAGLTGTAGRGGSAGITTTGTAGRGGGGGTTGLAGGGGGAGRGGGGGSAAGVAGAGGGGGGAGGSSPCLSCAVKVTYTCSQSNAAGDAGFSIFVVNNAVTTVALSDITVRYWYTSDPGLTQKGECYYAALENAACSAISYTIKAATPPKTNANSYLEVSFAPSLGTLTAFQDTGEIKLAIHNDPYGPTFNQADDYSFDCGSATGTTPIEEQKITAYVRGVLIWGSEPP